MKKLDPFENLVLDKEEQELERAFTAGEYQSVPNGREQIEHYKEMAQRTLAKNKSITLRINAIDLERLKCKALEKGLPYQTMLGSVIHQLVTDGSAEL